MLSCSASLQKINLQMDPDVSLPSYLIKPIQRICKYPLLIKELIRYTEDSDPQKNILRDALTAMQQTTVFINELKRRRECMAAVADIEKKIVNWKGCDLRCYGELRIEGTFPIVQADGSREPHRLFLFEKLFMYCKEGKKNQYHLVGKFVMRDSTVGFEALPSKRQFFNFIFFFFTSPIPPPSSSVPAAPDPLWIQVYPQRCPREGGYCLGGDRRAAGKLDDGDQEGH